MKKNIYCPVFFTATIRYWKKLLKPEKYKEVVLEQLIEQINKDYLMVYVYCPDSYRDGQSYSYYLASERKY